MIATCRRPATADALQAIARDEATLRIAALDVADHDEVEALAAELRGLPIDVLLNNAGIMGPPLARQTLGTIDYTAAATVFETNCLGALHVAEAFRPHVAASEAKRVVCISSGNGSISLTAAEPRSGLYLYRASKAALNVVMAAYSRDVTTDGISVLLLSPGLVDSNFADGSGADLGGVTLLSPAASVSAMLKLLDRPARPEFAWLRYSGESVAW